MEQLELQGSSTETLTDFNYFYKLLIGNQQRYMWPKDMGSFVLVVRPRASRVLFVLSGAFP